MGMKSFFDVSSYMLNRVNEDFQKGVKVHTHGNKYWTFYAPKREKALAVIKYFVETHCENLPDQQVLLMPGHVIRKTLFEYYLEKTSVDLQLKERHFYRLLQEYFTSTNRKYVN